MSGHEIKIGKGQEYDITQIPLEGLTEEELKAIEKKNKKLINIYNTDHKDGLSVMELGLAMDGFIKASNGDNVLTDKELEEYAKKLNKPGEKDITAKDLKRFLKDITGLIKKKGSEKSVSTSNIRHEKIKLNNEIKDIMVQEDFNPVEGETRIFEKGGVYVRVTIGDNDTLEGTIVVPQTDETGKTVYVEPPEEEAAEEPTPEELALNQAIDDGYTDEGNGVLAKDGKQYIMQDGKPVRAKMTNGTMTAMTDDQIAKETPTSYTVQFGEDYTNLIKKSLMALHEGEEGYKPTADDIAKAKAEFEKNNPNAVKTNKSGKNTFWPVQK